MTLPQIDFGSPGKDLVPLLIHHPSPFLQLAPITPGTFLPFKGFNSWPECSYHVPQPVQPETKTSKKAGALAEGVDASCSSGAIIKAPTDEMMKPQQAENSFFLLLCSFKDIVTNFILFCLGDH